MPSPHLIRKEILSALEESIIPVLWRQQIPLGYVAPPFRFPPGISVRRLQDRVPRPDSEPPDHPIKTSWSRAKLHSKYYPYIGFVYQGAADERTLVSAEQAVTSGQGKGLYSIRWTAPGALLFPPGTPCNDGAKIFWDGPQAPPATKILCLRIYSELFVHIHTEGMAAVRRSSHALQINDRPALDLARLFVKELSNAEVRDQDLPRAVLLALMLRLQKSLHAVPPKIANTAYAPLPSEIVPVNEHTEAICRQAADFILMHLHEPLSLALIAHKVALSPSHLNRLFHRVYGITVMHYVRRQRIAAAKQILAVGPENIAEIAKLVGFKHATAFCSVFRSETGLTPGQFRHHSRHIENSFGSADERNLK